MSGTQGRTRVHQEVEGAGKSAGKGVHCEF